MFINELIILTILVDFLIKIIPTPFMGKNKGGNKIIYLLSVLYVRKWIYLLIFNISFIPIKFLFVYYYKINKKYLFFIPVLSLFSIIYLLFNNKIKIHKTKKHARNVKKIYPILFFPILIAPLIAISFTFNTKSVDDPSKTYIPVTFSKKKVNVVEIFSDGLDPDYLQKTQNFSNLKDFHFFKNVIGSGFYTHFGLRNIFFGENKNNNLLSGGDRFSMLIERLNKLETKKVKYLKTIIGTSEVKNPDMPKSHFASFSGNATKFENLESIKNNNIHVMNWSRGVQDMYQKHHIIGLAPYSAQYENFLDDIYVNNNRPSYTQIMENITHHPIRVNNKGYLTPVLNLDGIQSSFNYLTSFLKRLSEKLIEKGVYNNTEIVVYGDHGAHNKEPVRFLSEKSKTKKNISALLIKPAFINSQHKINQSIAIHNKPLSSIFVRRMINDTINGINNTFDDYLNSRRFFSQKIFATFVLNNNEPWVWFNKLNNNGYMISAFDKSWFAYKNNNLDMKQIIDKWNINKYPEGDI